MKLSPISKEHILEAGQFVDEEGIPKDYIDNDYWVQLPNSKEYPFKYITRIAYQLTPGNQQKWLKFESNKGYRAYIKSLGFSINYYPEGLNFFTVHEIEHFEKIGGTRYRKDNLEDIKFGERLRPTVKKMNLWAKLSQVEDFICKPDTRWQWSGTIKDYLWIRLFRQGDSQKVYFTVELKKTGSLNVEINCQYSNHSEGKKISLPKSKVELFNEYLESANYSPLVIQKERISKYTWARLVEETQNYIYKNAALYDELEKLVNEKSILRDSQIVEFSLLETDPPKQTKSYVNTKRSFKGRDTDWSKKHTTSIFLGREGESLVIEHEKRKLKQYNLIEKIDLIQKQLDGVGYDILSFDKEGNEIHIEVKTTKGNKDEPFYMSANEVEYFKEYPENYFLYRLYDYHYLTKTAEFYILTAKQLESSEMNPTNYEIVLG
jgi:hypothetical protein